MPINLTIEKIENALPNIRIGLEKYLLIQKMVEQFEFYNDPLFRRKFNGFYRMRRGGEFQNQFFLIFDSGNIDFEYVLQRIFNFSGRYEASFASKLIATIDPGFPVIDKHVLNNLNLSRPQPKDLDKLNSWLNIYNRLISEFTTYLTSETGLYLLRRFDEMYPYASGIDPIKKLDFILWQSR